MNNNDRTMWVTRQKNGMLSLHPFGVPIYNKNNGKWSQGHGWHSIEIPNIFPELTLLDGPIKVRIVPEESLMGLYKIIDNYKNVDSKE